MNCEFCNDTGKYKKPKNQERFDSLVDAELQKGYFVSPDMAMKKAYDKVGFTWEQCPYCSNA